MRNSANKKISFEGLLKEKPARVTYIDFWASWCAPCRTEMPNLKNLKTQFAGLGIEFICISIDETFTDWQSANAKENLDYYTNSYIINNPRNSAIIKQIKLTSIPRYLIYNKKGNLLNADAPAPGDPALLSLLNKLLKE
jgi:thiol-disulfide isomerase/thioredoxin